MMKLPRLVNRWELMHASAQDEGLKDLQITGLQKETRARVAGGRGG